MVLSSKMKNKILKSLTKTQIYLQKHLPNWLDANFSSISIWYSLHLILQSSFFPLQLRTFIWFLLEKMNLIVRIITTLLEQDQCQY